MKIDGGGFVGLIAETKDISTWLFQRPPEMLNFQAGFLCGTSPYKWKELQDQHYWTTGG